MLCYAMPMLCYAMPCHAMPSRSHIRRLPEPFGTQDGGWRMEDGMPSPPADGRRYTHRPRGIGGWARYVCAQYVGRRNLIDGRTRFCFPKHTISTHRRYRRVRGHPARCAHLLHPPALPGKGRWRGGGGGEEEPCTERRGVGGHSAVARRGGGENHGDGMSPAGIIGTWTCHEMSRQAASHISPPRQRYPRQGWIEAFPPWRVRATSDLFPWRCQTPPPPPQSTDIRSREGEGRGLDLPPLGK